MLGDVAAVIEDLRRHFGVTTDAELARQLSIDKSTISSWRSRGRIPIRYRGIVDGTHRAPAPAPPVAWTQLERIAFDLALLRFARAMGPKLDGGDAFSSWVAYQKANWAFWPFVRSCHDEIAERGRDVPSGHYQGAYTDTLKSYFERGEAGIEADRRFLLNWPEVTSE